jgi:hypothetical protein
MGARKFYLLWIQKYLANTNDSFPALSHRLKNVLATEVYSGPIWQIRQFKNTCRKLFGFKS